MTAQRQAEILGWGWVLEFKEGAQVGHRLRERLVILE